ncbi:MAG: Gfo/Idh/MocA family oxidoreductase [Planctomycetota bacterium]
MSAKKRYAVVGVSNRAIGMFMDPVLNEYAGYAELVAMMDKGQSRIARYNNSRKVDVPTFAPDQFDTMITKTRPDIVIVACYDSMHHHYIIKALEHNIDVITEKPLTIDEDKCAAIAMAETKSNASVTVTFNYRYTPHATKIKELIAEGKIGKVVSVDLNWYIDTYHGSSYFQRWNRLRKESGGLSVHKSCHHFDLVHWWIDQNPEEVFAYGGRIFYGPDGVHNPLKPDQIRDGRICLCCDVRNSCKYYMRWYSSELRDGGDNSMMTRIDDHVDVSQEYEDYSPRQCIFDPQIDIEDTYSAVIKYDGGAFLNYSLNASVPYKGFSLGINGTHGQIEFKELHAPWRFPFPAPAGDAAITYIPMFGGREQIDTINLGGGHGGGDPLLRDELFIGPDPLTAVRHKAELKDGIEAVLTGVAVYKSVLQGKPVELRKLRTKVFGR